jgi:hypothetical protein
VAAKSKDNDPVPFDRYMFQPGMPLDSASMSKVLGRLSAAAWDNSHDTQHFGFPSAASSPVATLTTAATAVSFAWPSVGGYAATYKIPFYFQANCRKAFAIVMVTSNRSYPINLRMKSGTIVSSHTAVTGGWSQDIDMSESGIAPSKGWASTPEQYLGSAMLDIEISNALPASRVVSLEIQAQIALTALPYTFNSNATLYLHGGAIVGSFDKFVKD